MMALAGVGFEPLDEGPIIYARYLEAMPYSSSVWAIVMKMGPEIGLRLVKR